MIYRRYSRTSNKAYIQKFGLALNTIYRQDEELSAFFKDLWLNEHDIFNKIGSRNE